MNQDECLHTKLKDVFYNMLLYKFHAYSCNDASTWNIFYSYHVVYLYYFPNILVW
jgi:hypothetical protein